MDYHPDVTVKCSDDEVKTHKYVLMFCSDYFTKCFTSGFREIVTPEICFPANALTTILNVMFYNKITGEKTDIYFSEINDIVACAEFLFIRTDLNKFVNQLFEKAEGESVSGIIDIVAKYKIFMSSNVMNSLHVDDLVKLYTKEPKCICNLGGRKTYELYRALPPASVPVSSKLYHNASHNFTIEDYWLLYCAIVHIMMKGPVNELSDALRIMRGLKHRSFKPNNPEEVEKHTLMYAFANMFA